MDRGENINCETKRKDAPPSFNPRMERHRRKKELEQKERELAERLKQIDKSVELEELREHGKNDFFFFCKEIMGFKDLYEPLHRPLCEFVSTTESRRKLLLIPRGHFKTTIGSISYPIWKLINNPQERIALMSVTSDLAEDNLKELVMKIDDQRVQGLYGHILPNTKTWPMKRGFELRCPRRGSKVGPSLYSCGVESSETGRHFSTIIIDDMVNDQNTRSKDQLDKIWDWFGRQESVLDADGEFLVIGTRWSWGDPYGRIEKLADWTKMILSAVNKQGKVIFPTVFSKKKLETIRATQGDYRYSCFYENNPTGHGVNPFDTRKFQWVDYKEQDQESWRYILVDPATTTNDWSHPTGIIVGDALAKEKAFVVVKAIRDKFNPDQLISKLVSLCKQEDPYEVIVEADAAHTACVYWLRQKIMDKKLGYHVKSIKNPVRIGRETRTINILQPRMHSGEVLFSKSMEGRDTLLEELASFPKGRTDDLIMALSAVAHVVYPRAHERPKKKIMDRRTQIFNNLIANASKRKGKRKIPRTRMKLWA